MYYTLKRFLLILLLTPSILISQIQIGQDIDGEAPGDGSGVSVALSADGSIMAVGAGDSNDGIGFTGSGYVRVYQNQSDNWVQMGQKIEGIADFDEFGYAISLSADGTILAVGASAYSPLFATPNVGRVKIYQYQSSNWVQIGQDIDGEDSADYFGYSISLSSDGNRIAIGAPVNDEGYTKIYENQSGVWTQVGQKIIGEATGDQSGFFVSLSSDGSVVAIGADSNDGNGFDAGHVRVYQDQSGNWIQIGQDIDGAASEDFFGLSVSLSANGNIVAIGGIGNDGNGIDSGHVRIFENQSGVWAQIGQDIEGEAAGDQSGFFISLSSDGSVVAIGADSNDGNGIDSGHVRIFQNQSGIWTQVGSDINGEAASDFSGQSVALSANGAIVAIGAPNNDGNGDGSGHVRIYENTSLLSTEKFTTTKKYTIVGEGSKITVLTNEEIKLSVFNINGVSVSNENLTTGMYLARITNMQGQSTVQKVIVK